MGLRREGLLLPLLPLAQLPVPTLPDYRFHQTRVCPLGPTSCFLVADDIHSVPVYDARPLCSSDGDINLLRSYKSYWKDGLERLGNTDIAVGSFVGVGYCAKWIPSKRARERVQLTISEVFLLADPPVDGPIGGGSAE